MMTGASVLGSPSTTVDVGALRVQLLLDATSAAAAIAEEERLVREAAFDMFAKGAEAMARMAVAAAAHRQRARADLEAFEADARRIVDAFAAEAFFDIVRNAQRSAHKKLARAASASPQGQGLGYGYGSVPQSYANSAYGSPVRASHPPSPSSPPQHRPHAEGALSPSSASSAGPAPPSEVAALLAAVAKMQESQAVLQAELLLAVRQGALQPSPPQPPLSMASVLPPRPMSASLGLRPVRAHPPPTFARGNVPMNSNSSSASGTPRAQTSAGPRPLSPSTASDAAAVSPSSRARSAAASVAARRERLLSPHRPASSPVKSHFSRERGAEALAQGHAADAMGDSFIKEDDDASGDEDGFEAPAPQAVSKGLGALEIGIGGVHGKSPTQSMALRPSTPRRPASGTVRVPVPPGASARLAQKANASAAVAAANASVEELVALITGAAEEEEGGEDGSGGIGRLAARLCAPSSSLRGGTLLTVSFAHLTHLDLSRAYVGDGGLARLIEVLSLHEQPKGGDNIRRGVRRGAAPMALPHLSALSLQQNGLSGAHLPSLLFEALGVPLSDNSEWAAAWASPPPAAGYLLDFGGGSGRRSISVSAVDGKRIGAAPWLAACGDTHVAAVVRGVVSCLLTAVRRSLRQSDTCKAKGNGSADTETPSSEASAAALLVHLPSDYVTVENVRVALPLEALGTLLSAAVGRPLRCVLPSGDGREGEREGVEGGGEGQAAPDSSNSNKSVDGVISRLREAQRSRSARGDGSAAEESPFFRPIRYLDLSHNAGITPRCNRDLLAYARLNPLLRPMSTAPLSRPPTPPPPPAAAVGSGAVAAVGLHRRPLPARTATPQQIAKSAAYAADGAKSACPIVLDGTSLFEASVAIVAAAVARRAAAELLVMEGVGGVFSHCWAAACAEEASLMTDASAALPADGAGGSADISGAAVPRPPLPAAEAEEGRRRHDDDE